MGILQIKEYQLRDAGLMKGLLILGYEALIRNLLGLPAAALLWVVSRLLPGTLETVILVVESAAVLILILSLGIFMDEAGHLTFCFLRLGNDATKPGIGYSYRTFRFIKARLYIHSYLPVRCHAGLYLSGILGRLPVYTVFYTVSCFSGRQELVLLTHAVVIAWLGTSAFQKTSDLRRFLSAVRSRD